MKDALPTELQRRDGTANLPQSLSEKVVGLEGEEHEDEGRAEAEQRHRHRHEQHLLDGLSDRILNLEIAK